MLNETDSINTASPAFERSQISRVVSGQVISNHSVKSKKLPPPRRQNIKRDFIIGDVEPFLHIVVVESTYRNTSQPDYDRDLPALDR